MKLEIAIALRYTFTKHKEKFVSIINTFAMIGIALGVATLIIVMSVMNGYEQALFTRILGFKGHITITTKDSRLTNWQDIQNTLQTQLLNTLAIVPVIEMQALVMANKNTTGVLIKGMELNDIKQKITLSDGSFFTKEHCKGLILGNLLNENLNYSEKAKIILPKFNDTMIGAIPRMKTYDVCGTFDIGMHEYNSGIIFMELKDAQLLYEMQNAVTGIEVTVNNLQYVPQIKQQILSILRNNKFDNTDLLVIDWQQANQTLMDVLKIESTVMFLILSLIIMIAAFNIISSLILLVHDKMKEIAILRTIGMTKKSIMAIFMISGSLIGLSGTIFGTILGIIFSLNIEKIRQFLESISSTKIFDPVIYFLTSLPSSIDYIQVLYIICISLGLSFVATIYPAWRVSKTSPATVLKY